MKYLVCHAREVRRYAWFEAESEEEALMKAQREDEDESDSDLWETEDNDPGEFEIRVTIGDEVATKLKRAV